MEDRRMSTLLLVFAVLALVGGISSVYAACSTVPWSGNEVLNKACTEVFKVTATSTMQTLTLTNKSKAIGIKNWGTSDVMMNPQGSVVTASTGGMPISSKGNSGDFYGNDLTTKSISYISMTGGSSVLFIEVDS